MTTLVAVHLANKTQPTTRGEIFEDPLHEVLQDAGLGEVSGGGTQLTEIDEVDYCDLDVDVTVAGDKTVALIIATLEKSGAAKGSYLTVGQDTTRRAFGKLEGLGLYLNGTDLPDEVYAAGDATFVYDEVNRLLAGAGFVQDHWQGPTETALYVYGTSFAKMRELIEPLLSTYALCQKARVVQIA